MGAAGDAAAGAGAGAAGGPVGALIGAGIGLASPFIAKGLGSLFGLDEPSDQEKRAAALREASLQRLRDAADGKTASPAQLAALQQQQRTVHALASMAQKGTVQQRAGNVRAAMQATPEVMAQQGAVAAQTRAAEMSNARSQLAGQEASIATSEAEAGRKDREYMQKIVGAGVQGGAAMVGDALAKKGENPSKDGARPASTSDTPYGSSSQAATAGPAAAVPASAAPTAPQPQYSKEALSGGSESHVQNSVTVPAPSMSHSPYAPRLGKPIDAETAAARGDVAKPFTLGTGVLKKKEPSPTNAMSRDTAKDALISGYTEHYGVAPNQETTNMLLAQWALETGHGKSMPKHNFGGLTGVAPTGGTANLATVEGHGATARNTTRNFRTYDTPEQGAADFVGVLKRRHQPAMDAAAAGDARGFAAALKKSGYYSGDPEAYGKAIDSLYRHSPPASIASTARRQGGV